MYRILIVEDDTGIGKAIEEQLEKWSFNPRCVRDFRNVINDFIDFDPHLILLDIALPFFNGYHWCNEIRKISKVPIIFISSASDNMNLIMAINMGGDDFIGKPFDQNVLMAKIQGLLRRSYNFSLENSFLQHREAILNLNDNTLSYRDEKIELTKNEYRILHTLMENKGKVVSRQKLMDTLWQTDIFIDENTLTVNVNRLRKKLDKVDLTDFITTKFGIGYIIE